MSTSTIDYDALAQQAGGTPAVDYDALAAQHGGNPIPPAHQEALGLIDQLRNYVDTKLAPNDNGNHPIENTLLGAAHGVANMILHPVNSVLNNGSAPGNYPGMAYTGYKPADDANGNNPVPLAENAKAAMIAAKNNPSYTVGSIVGPLAATAGIAKGIDVAPAAGSAIREGALGDPNAAALRGLRVPPSSPKAIQTLNAVEGARPFLQGSDSLEDLQNRVPVAKQEIWQPYQDALAKVGDKHVKGPDGNMTTVQDLENRRLELSAQLRTLRNGGPEAMALAQQKGLTQANLLREQSAVQMALDPQLRSAGIDPVAIRKAFGQVSQVGSKIAGKSTVAEASQPSGLGRMLNLQIDSPRTWIGEPAQGVRDIAAGRPLWSANPTDMNIREGFRTGGPKPDFTVPVQAPTNIAGLLQRPPIELSAGESSTPLSQPPSFDYSTRAIRQGKLLPAQTGGPIELPYVPEMSGGEQLAALMHYLRTHPQKALPAKASAIPLGSGQ